jgi:hypothetical protein
VFYIFNIDSSEFHKSPVASSPINVVEEWNPPEEPGSSAGASFSPRAKTYTHPRVCRNLDQFQAWQRSRPWLSLNSETGNLKCTSCAEVKQTGLHTQKGQHYESAFIDGTVQSLTAKKLLKKIDKHRD